MPDDAPNREGLRRAARVVLDRIRKRAPTEKSAASFRTIQRGNGDIEIVSSDPGTSATEYQWSHPLFGDRSHWFRPAGKQIGRSHFVELAANAALNQAASDYADTWIRVFTDTSPYWADEG